MENLKHRKLPRRVLLLDQKSNLESTRVREKFSNADAKIEEENVDYVALGYLNAEAALYWLPHFFDYLRNVAPRDSYHFEVMLLNLSDEAFFVRLGHAVTEKDSMTICSFLHWLETCSGFVVGSELRRRDLERAKCLWCLGELSDRKV